MIRVAINGFGRIGRLFFRQAWEHPDLEVVAVNDLGDIENLAYLLKYDTVYGRFKEDVKVKDGTLMVGSKKIPMFSEKDPLQLPWKKLDVGVVVEATGVFTKYELAKVHLGAGAKRVVITAPAKDDPLPDIGSATVLMGVNEEKLETCQITSNGSCTTNAASPVVAILEKALDIEQALLDTIHGYTATQSLVDSASTKDWRKGRAAAQNIIPSSTGAAISVTKAVEGIPFFDGIAVRVPVIAGSYADLTFVTKKSTTPEEVNDILRKAAQEERWKHTFAVSDEPLVSSDIIGQPYGGIADLSFTRVAGGNLIKVLSWYDNEYGYVSTLVRHVVMTGKYVG